MGLEVKTERIGDFTYRVTQLGARESGRVFFKLCNMFAPVFDGLDVKGSADLESTVFSGLSRAMANAKAEDFEELVRVFGKTTEVEVAPDQWPRMDRIYEEHFAGRFLEQIQWVVFCVRANYSNFLDVMRARLGEKSKPAAPASS